MKIWFQNHRYKTKKAEKDKRKNKEKSYYLKRHKHYQNQQQNYQQNSEIYTFSKRNFSENLNNGAHKFAHKLVAFNQNSSKSQDEMKEFQQAKLQQNITKENNEKIKFLHRNENIKPNGGKEPVQIPSNSPPNSIVSVRNMDNSWRAIESDNE